MGKIYQKCQRCNRILKSDKAKERGYGDYCWKLHNMQIKQSKKTLLDMYIQDSKKV